MSDIFEFRGASDLVYAEVTADNEDTYTTGTVKPLAGLAKVSKQTASSKNTKYYDNKPRLVITDDGEDTITLDVSALDLETYADITGQYYDSATGMLVETLRKSKTFALGYKTQNSNGDDIYVWRLKGSFDNPNEDHETRNGQANSNGQTLVYTGIYTTHKFDKISDFTDDDGSGKSVVVNVSKGLISDADIEAFFDEVQTPDSINPKTPSA